MLPFDAAIGPFPQQSLALFWQRNLFQPTSVVALGASDSSVLQGFGSVEEVHLALFSGYYKFQVVLFVAVVPEGSEQSVAHSLKA